MPPPPPLPADDLATLPSPDELVYLHDSSLVERAGTVGLAGRWRVVSYPSRAAAAHAYALECSRLHADGFADYAPQVAIQRIGVDDVELLAAFYDEVYLPEFAHQREPFASWLSALRGEAAYQLCALVATDGDAVTGGVIAERYPRSHCGLITYLAVAPRARRAGLGARLLAEARSALAPLRLVLGEISDPRRYTGDAAEAAQARLARFQRWGAQVLDLPYVQPDLGAGLGRDRGLLLVVFLDDDDPAPDRIDSAALATFLREFYEVTEGVTDDPDLAAMLARLVG